MSHKILVIGCGSIGERHIRTFLATQRCAAVACDNRPAIREQMTSRYGVPAVEDWRAALRDRTLTGVVVATPAPLHIPMSIEVLDAGLHVMIEKPLSISLDGVESLRAARDRAGRAVMIGYTYRSFPAAAGAHAFIRSGGFGPLRHIVVVTGQHFPTFRPAYREIYYRDRAQGGGAIQDALTHMANTVEWIAGPTTWLFCDAAHQALEGVDVEDTVNVVARNGDVMVNYSLNQFQAPSEVRMDFHSAQGSVRIDARGERWGTLERGEQDWTWRPTPVANRDAMYVAQANSFLDACEGRAPSLCALEEAEQTLRFNLAALRSAQSRKPEKV